MNIRLESYWIAVAASASALACARQLPKIDYRSADPVVDARRALLDSGHFHLMAVKVGDSVISPTDTTVLQEKSYNVEVAPEGGVIFLAIDPSPTRSNWPSDQQLRYIKRYNTELFALLDSNAMAPEGLPPNQRMKLPPRGGRLKGN